MNKKQNSKQKIQKLAENDARPERAIQPTELLNDTLRRIFGCELADATQKQVYRALCISVRELLTEKNRVFGNRCTEKERKEVYYMSMEFLVGTSLRNNLFNLGLEAEFRKALADAGFDIDEIYRHRSRRRPWKRRPRPSGLLLYGCRDRHGLPDDRLLHPL